MSVSRNTDRVAAERESPAIRLNRTDLRHSLDHGRLRQALENGSGVCHADLRKTHPHLFAETPVYADAADCQAMARLIEAIERVVALPAWRDRALAQASLSSHQAPATAGAFLGYDFHLSEHGPRLIEINTNAGGGLLNAKLLRAQKAPRGCGKSFPGRLAKPAAVESDFVAMFREEWRLAGGEQPLRRIAIVDDAPQTQFLLPEFLLFRQLFKEAGIDAFIADPRQLALKQGRLCCDDREVDLVYNRLTDFSLAAPANAVLRAAWLDAASVLTPHPHAHALYADKRNLVALSDGDWLRGIGVRPDDLAVLQAGVPRAELLLPENAEAFWDERRRWFFKPAAGYGGKAAYRGDKLTRRVFAGISEGGYIAQALVPPSERGVYVDGAERQLKLDVRNFVYRGRIQLVSARLYQGQTTNFRTHGGGFAAVRTV